LKDYLKKYQEDIHEKFNKEFILLRENDNVIQYIDSICRALEVIDGIEYVGGEIITDESLFKNPGKSKNEKSFEKAPKSSVNEIHEWIPVKESRLNLIRIKFNLTNDEGEKIPLEKDIYVPKLINNFYFILNGSKYFPILQIVDKSTYNNEKSQSVILKTLLMPIVIRFQNNITIESLDDLKFTGKRFFVYLFKHKINVMNYYYAKYGFTKTMEILNISPKKINIIDNTTISSRIKSKYHIFHINSNISLILNKKLFNKSKKPMYLTNLIVTILDVFNNRNKIDDLDDKTYWRKRFGQFFTKNTNNQIQKAEKILLSFNRIFDTNTKRFLKINKKYKKNIYTVIKWMMEKYETLLSKDNFDLKNKRIRLYEYLVYPLLMKFSKSTYRILNSKNVNYARLKSVFSTVSPGFIIKKLLNHELLRYSGDSNTIDIFNTALRFTYKGPQSISSSGGTLSVKYRGLHPSYIGRVSLTASSAGDPGSTGIISPLIKSDGLFFSDENE